jgi:hypothetical protein
MEGKKRERDESDNKKFTKKNKQQYIQEQKNNEDEYDWYEGENGERILNLPKKSQFRMRAHCNPLAEISIP